MIPAPRPCVVGVGAPWRHDDAVGLDVVARLQGRLDSTVELVPCDGDLAALLLQWKGRPLVVVVDAMRSGAPAGSIVRLEPVDASADAARLVAARPRSTHAVGVAEAIALAESLDLLPTHLVCYGIEVDDVSYGAGLTPDVHAAAERVTGLIVAEFARPPAPLTDTAGSAPTPA